MSSIDVFIVVDFGKKEVKVKVSQSFKTHGL